MFGGSSKYRLVDGELLEANQIPKTNWRRKKQNPSSKHIEMKFISELSETKEEKKTFMLNKSKVKKRCNALSRLEKSKKFLAFYSISFRMGLPDESAYKIFNTWLTRCRKNMNLNSYLWVAERQKNGTIHFHLLTNDFMPIKEVNRYMAQSFKSEQKRELRRLKK